MRAAAFAKYVPDHRLSVEDCILATGASAPEAKAFARLFGIHTVSCTPDDMSLADAFSSVLDQFDLRETLPEVLIYVHGNPVQYRDGDNPMDALVHSHPFLANIIDIYEMDQQNCSSLFWALDAAQRLIDADSGPVLVLAGDCLAQMPVDERYAPGVTAIGDAFCGLLLDARAGGNRIENIWLNTRPQHYAGRFGTAPQTAAFNAEHADMVDAILSGIGMADDMQAPILPHNVNSLSWRLYARQTGIDAHRIWLDLLPEKGHCYTVDAVSMLDRFQSHSCSEASLLSVGQGGFLGGCKIRKEAG